MIFSEDFKRPAVLLALDQDVTDFSRELAAATGTYIFDTDEAAARIKGTEALEGQVEIATLSTISGHVTRGLGIFACGSVLRDEAFRERIYTTVRGQGAVYGVLRALYDKGGMYAPKRMSEQNQNGEEAFDKNWSVFVDTNAVPSLQRYEIVKDLSTQLAAIDTTQHALPTLGRAPKTIESPQLQSTEPELPIMTNRQYVRLKRLFDQHEIAIGSPEQKRNPKRVQEGPYVTVDDIAGLVQLWDDARRSGRHTPEYTSDGRNLPHATVIDFLEKFPQHLLPMVVTDVHLARLAIDNAVPPDDATMTTLNTVRGAVRYSHSVLEQQLDRFPELRDRIMKLHELYEKIFQNIRLTKYK